MTAFKKPDRSDNSTSHLRRSDAHRSGQATRKKIVEDAYESFKLMILSNELPPGYQALEQDLADLLSISRTPVREVLTRLQEEGLVERIPRRGFRILAISHNDIRELYELLQCLEGKAVELLALRRLTADSPEMDKIIKANDAAGNFFKSGDMKAWSEADWHFHHSIFEGCCNLRLARMATQTWEQVHRVDITTMNEKSIPHYSPQDHQAILNAILQHDGITARELIYSHRLTGMNILLEAISYRKMINKPSL